MPRPKQSRIVEIAFLVSLISAASPLGATAGQQTRNSVIHPTSDESSLEEAIRHRLMSKGIDVLRVPVGSPRLHDEQLAIALSGDGLPPVFLVIDTFASRQDGKHRAVVLQLQTGLVVASTKRTQMLELINKRNQERWAGTYYLDDQGVLTCDWVLNVTEDGLPWANLEDAMGRMIVGWLECYRCVRPSLSPLKHGRIMPGPDSRRGKSVGHSPELPRGKNRQFRYRRR